MAQSSFDKIRSFIFNDRISITRRGLIPCRPLRLLRLQTLGFHKESLAVQTPDLSAALPPIPPRPTTRPTPWLLPAEMDKYLIGMGGMIPWRAVPATILLKRKDGPPIDRNMLGMD